MHHLLPFTRSVCLGAALRRLQHVRGLISMQPTGLLVIAFLASYAHGQGAPVLRQSTVRVSIDSLGIQGNDASTQPSLSATGRFVAFDSLASSLVQNDTNAASDVFFHDRITGQTTCVSVDLGGQPGNGASSSPALSEDGRFVVFQSLADNLVPVDTNGQLDVFVRDQLTGTTACVSVDSNGNQGNLQSGDASISGSGRYVAFISFASNLVPGDTNGTWDMFVHDLVAVTTSRVSVDSSGNQANGQSGFFSGPSISRDGQLIAFASLASNLVPNDTNGQADVFVHDQQTGQTFRASLDSLGNQGNAHSGYQETPQISPDGRYVVFSSYASNLVLFDTNGAVDVFVRDTSTGETSIVSISSQGMQGNGNSGFLCSPAISLNGRFVAFQSHATNLQSQPDTNNSPDVFLHDCQTGETLRVSVDSLGTEGNAPSGGAFFASLSISDTGRSVAFSSFANNLVSGDLNGKSDVFVRTIHKVRLR